MKDIAIYGAGGFGREVACLINKINKLSPQWNLVGFFSDSESEWGTVNEYGKVLGGADVLNSWPTPIDITIAIGSPIAIVKIYHKLHNDNIDFPNIIAPNVLFFDEENVDFGKGNIVTFGCRLSCNTKLGNFNVLNGNISLGHDAELGDFNVLFPETRISGHTKIGNRNFFGARTFVAQGLTIGDNCRFGAGTYVFRKINKVGLYMGNPAKKIEIN